MRRAAFLLPICAFVLTRVAAAADFCVASASDFHDAMIAVFGNPGPHVVRIVVGDYLITEDIEFVGPNGLTIEGGYATNCLTKSFGAQTTTLRGPDDVDIRPSFHAVDGDLVIRDLAIRNFTGAYIWADGVGATLLAERVAVLTRPSAAPGPLAMHPNNGSISLHEMVVDGSFGASCALSVNVYGGYGIAADGLTVRNREGGPAVCFTGPADSMPFLFENSIAESDGGVDVIAGGEAPIRITTSIVNTTTGPIDPLSSGNIVGPAIFEATTDELLRDRLADIAQPARDSATPEPDATLDILGRPRTVGAGPDRGAFESQPSCDEIFKASFDLAPCPSAQGHGHSAHHTPLCVPIAPTC